MVKQVVIVLFLYFYNSDMHKRDSCCARPVVRRLYVRLSDSSCIVSKRL